MAMEQRYGDMSLVADLANLVEVGLLVEITEPGEASRYALSALGEALTASSTSCKSCELPWPEPCPCCGATEGYDGGGRCLSCRVAWPPEM